MANEMKLFTSGSVTTKDGRKFTRLMGGFGENKPIVTVKQISELLNKEPKHVTELINSNIKYFTKDVDYIDLKVVDSIDYNLQTLIELGYTKMSISKSEYIYILSQAGFLLYLKFAEGDKVVELYKEFIEDYFKTKAENIIMTKTLQQQLEFLEEQRCMILGKMFTCKDPDKKMEYFQQNEDYAEQIKQIELTLAKENIIEQLQPQLTIADRLTNTDSCYDMNAFAKALAIKGLGRNNMFEWLRQNGILRHNNEPYDRYMKYFKVIYTPNPYNNNMNVKTLVRPKGVPYIFKKLIEDGKIINMSVEDILKELEPETILN